MKLRSTAFTAGGKIPDQYTMGGNNRIPPLQIEEVPEEALSVVLILEDADSPDGTVTHWLLANVDPEVRNLDEKNFPPDLVQGSNDFGKTAYVGPRPSAEEHRYLFKAYALDWVLSLQDGVRRDELESAMEDHVLETATLVGKYVR